MPVSIEGTNEIIIAYLSGEIDHHTARGMREKIDREVRAQKPSLLVLDFSSVSFMDSSGIGLVMGRYKLLQETGGALSVVNVPKNAYKIMTLAGLQSLASITETEKR